MMEIHVLVEAKTVLKHLHPIKDFTLNVVLVPFNVVVKSAIFTFIELHLLFSIRKNQEAVRGRAPASVLRGAGDTKALGSPQYNAHGNISMRVCLIRTHHLNLRGVFKPHSPTPYLILTVMNT